MIFYFYYKVPPISTIANLTIKSENISSAGIISSSSVSHQNRAATKINGLEQYYTSAKGPIVTETESPPSSPSPTHSPSPIAPSGRSTSYSLPDITSGCSRTVPISWTSSGSTSTTSASLVHVRTSRGFYRIAHNQSAPFPFQTLP